MVTIFEGAHISAACLSGDIVMGEMSHASWWDWIFYWASVGLIIGGIALVCHASHDAELGGLNYADLHTSFHPGVASILAQPERYSMRRPESAGSSSLHRSRSFSSFG